MEYWDYSFFSDKYPPDMSLPLLGGTPVLGSFPFQHTMHKANEITPSLQHSMKRKISNIANLSTDTSGSCKKLRKAQLEESYEARDGHTYADSSDEENALKVRFI